MGQYINPSDVAKRIEHTKLVQLTDDATPRTGEVDVDIVNEAISEAEGTFETYARGGGYALPVPATQKVKAVCLDIAVFQLFQRRSTTDEGIFKVKEKAYDKAIAYLKDVAARKAALDIPAAEETVSNPAGADRVLSGPATPGTFTKDNLRGF
jgi:phage gp36-like protein